MTSYCTGHVEDFCSQHANSLVYPAGTHSAGTIGHGGGGGTFRPCTSRSDFTASRTLKSTQSHLVCTGTGILKTVISWSAPASLPWSERINMYPECQTSCCSTVNPSGCLKCSLRRSLIQPLSAGSTFPLTAELGKLGFDGCLGEMHERRGRGAKMRQHLTENPDALIFWGSSQGVFPVTSQCCC